MDHWRNQRGNKKNTHRQNDNENATIQNLWYTAKAVLKAKFIGIQSYLEKREKSQINNLSLHLKQREKDKQNLKLAKGKKP